MEDDDDSVREREDEIVTPDPAPSVDPPAPPMSRREARLKREAERIVEISREQRLEERRLDMMARAAEITRLKQEEAFRLAEHERHQEQINNTQPIAPLTDVPVGVGVDNWTNPLSPPTGSMGWLPAPGESLPTLGNIGSRPILAPPSVANSGRTATPPTAPKSSKLKRKPAYRQVKGRGRGFVFLIIGALFVSLGLPATGFIADGTPRFTATEKQSLRTTSNGTDAENVALGQYYVTSYGQYLAMTYGSGGSWNYNVVNAGKIRWPFPMVVPISSGFGARVAPCLACSSFHEGMDFDPAEGTPFFAVADGVVSEVHDDPWGLGKWVVIHHEVGSNVFDSLYGHMLRDSTGVKVGQEVKVGDYIGRVGNSGTSTGAHLHFQIMIDGTPVDPFPFMKKYTLGNKSAVEGKNPTPKKSKSP